MKTTALFLFLSGLLINAYGQTEQERFGVHTGGLDFNSAAPYINSLGAHIYVRLGGGVIFNDEYGWYQVKNNSISEQTRCLNNRDSTRCPTSTCDCSPYSYYYSNKPNPRTPLPIIPEANPFMGFKINRYDSAIPTTQDSLIGDYPHGHEDEYLSYVDFLLQGYKDQSKYWEIGNENDWTFWVGTEKEYADLVALSSGKIRNTCSDCKVGVSFSLPVVAHKWYTELNAVLDTFDFVDAHNAVATGFMKPGSLDTIRKYWPGKEIISTETGLPDTLITVGQKAGGTPVKQAKDLAKFNTLMFAEGYSKIYWYLIDVDYGGGPIFLHNALIDENGIQKPAFTSYKTMISKVDSFTAITKLATGQYRYDFLSKGSVYVLWCDGAPGSCTLPPEISGTVKITDYMGNVSTMQAASIVLDSVAIYVELGVTSINENNISHNLSIYPNPFCTQTILQTDIFFKNATLTVDNVFGQQVKQIKNISGQTIIFLRDNLASGLYFVRLTQDGKTFSVDKLVITDN
jgi:hypothetical protein